MLVNGRYCCSGDKVDGSIWESPKYRHAPRQVVSRKMLAWSGDLTQRPKVGLTVGPPIDPESRWEANIGTEIAEIMIKKAKSVFGRKVVWG